MKRVWMAVCVGLLGCGDAAVRSDSGPADAGVPDLGREEIDAGPERCTGPVPLRGPIGARCGRLVDREGRTVTLHGINARIEGVFDVTFDDGRTAVEEVPPFTLDDARQMRAMGFDSLRLPINWSGVEPRDATPRAYDAAYVGRVRDVIRLAAQAGLLVLIDLHQDAWGKDIGEDGAPLWATVPPPTELLQGPLTDLAERRTSAQVVLAFQTFHDSRATGGVRLRARFAEMAQHIARELGDEPNVLGLELFNEPVSNEAQAHALNVQVGRAVREVAPDLLVVFEPPALPRNLSERSMVPAGAAPFPVAGAVYAPHIYTLAFFGDDAMRQSFTRATLEPNHRAAIEEAQQYRTPLLVTEWGYDPRGIRGLEFLALQSELQDELSESAMLWLWKEQSQGAWGLFDHDATTGAWTVRADVRRVISRPHVRRLAGVPGTIDLDRAARTLRVSFTGDAEVSAPNVLYVPSAEDFAAAFDVTCDGVAVTVTRDVESGEIIAPCGGSGEHVLLVSGR